VAPDIECEPTVANTPAGESALSSVSGKGPHSGTPPHVSASIAVGSRATGRLRFGLRTRLTALTVMVVGVVLVAGAVLLLQTLETRLVASLDASVELEASTRAADLAAGAEPADVVRGLAHGWFAWVEVAGETLAAGGSSSPAPPLVAGSPQTITTDLLEPGEEIETYEIRAVARDVIVAGSGGGLLVVASEFEGLSDALDRARISASIGVPAVLALVGILAWLITGRVLRPVEEIRSQAAEISGSELDRRVPETGAGDEIDRLAATVNGMLERLERHDSARKRFSSDASHELRTPLSNLRVLIEGSPGSQNEALLAEVDRLTVLVDDLLLMSVLDERESDKGFGTVHVDDLLFDEAEFAASVGVEVDVSGVSPAPVWGRRDDISVAIRNLVVNASRHAVRRVWLGSSVDGEIVVITVDDDGPGISPPDRDVIFERFARLDPSRDRSVGGAGLGLAIVRRVAIDHGGSVVAVDSPRSGARLELRLPAAR